jgi:hypothetical protein
MSQHLLQQKNTFVHIEDDSGRKSLRKTKTEPLEFAPEIIDEVSTAASEHSDDCMDFPTPIQAFQVETKQPLFLPRMDSKFFIVPHSNQDLRNSIMSISTMSSTGRNANYTGRSSSGLTGRNSMDFTGRSSMDFTGRSSMDFTGRNSISSTGRHSQIMSPSGRCDRLSRFAKDKEESQKTTVMIRNIPCRCTQPELLEEIEEVTPGVNFLYLPASRKREGTLGYIRELPLTTISREFHQRFPES